MHVITARSVNDAYYQGMKLLQDKGYFVDTRNGKAISMPIPVTTHYLNPRRRVITWASREANPYFHLYEALWMLAGCQAVSQLAYFNKRMAEFSDDGITLPASYGWRWRHFFDVDQIEATIQNIIKNPNDRRLVIGMFDPGRDVLTQRETKDVPCNVIIKFRVIHGSLDMMVFNRSNDIIWGAYGANAVHMSILQEYIAHASNLHVGEYWQISSDFHAYLPIFDDKIEGLRKEEHPELHLETAPLFAKGDKEERKQFDYDLGIVKAYKSDCLHEQDGLLLEFRSPFFKTVVLPMLRSYHYIKKHEYEKAILEVSAMQYVAPDWFQGCMIWIAARAKSYSERKDKQ
jgi:thymidylate synthase